MIEQAAVRGVSSSIVSSVGFVGMKSRPINDNTPVATIQQINNIKGTAVQIVKYLVSIDASLKAQVLANTFAYNQSVKQEREDLVEQYRGFGNLEPEEQQVPDATPVANEETSSVGMAVAALTAGAAALSFSAYKLYDMFQDSINNAMGSLAALVGLGSSPAPQAPERDVPEPAPIKQAPNPHTPLTRTNTPNAARGAPSETQESAASYTRMVTPVGAPSETATPPNRTSAPPVVNSPTTSTSTPPVTVKPANTSAPAAATPIGGTQLTGNNIVALGQELQGAGLVISGHSKFGGRELGKHSDNSRHYRDAAIDINAPGGIVEASDPVWGPKFDDLAKELRAAGYSVLWKTKGHYNHIHASVGPSEGSSGGGIVDSAMAVVSETFEDIKQSISRLAMSSRDKMQLMPEAEVSQSKNVEDNINRIRRDAEERERDILSAARAASIIHKVSQGPQQETPPPPPSARGKSTAVIGDYYERLLGVVIQPNQIGLA